MSPSSAKLPLFFTALALGCCLVITQYLIPLYLPPYLDPPLVLVAIVSILVYHPRWWWLSLFAGLLLDLASLSPLGLHALIFLVIAYLIMNEFPRWPRQAAWFTVVITTLIAAITPLIIGLLLPFAYWQQPSFWLASTLGQGVEALALTTLLLAPRLRLSHNSPA